VPEVCAEYLASINVTMTQFRDICKKIVESNDESLQDTLGFIVALSDYDTFYAQMRRVAVERRVVDEKCDNIDQVAAAC